MKKEKSGLTVLLVIVLLLMSATLIGVGVYMIYFKNRDAFERMDEERDLADDYVEDLLLQLRDPEAYAKKMAEARKRREAMRASRGWGSERDDFTEEYTDEYGERRTRPYGEYSDDNYFERDGIIYTPDYARGEIECRLEVPTAGISRGVYTGTWEDIAYDLDIWMVTAARPDYELGETHYCIYGHNHTVQDLSFNKLQKVQVNDYFYLTAESGWYVYRITDVFAVSRTDATRKYVDNFDISSDMCYLITCGRDDGERNFRYLDLVVEGELEEHLSLEEYAKMIYPDSDSKDK